MNGLLCKFLICELLSGHISAAPISCRIVETDNYQLSKSLIIFYNGIDSVIQWPLSVHGLDENIYYFCDEK